VHYALVRAENLLSFIKFLRFIIIFVFGDKRYALVKLEKSEKRVSCCLFFRQLSTFSYMAKIVKTVRKLLMTQ